MLFIIHIKPVRLQFDGLSGTRSLVAERGLGVVWREKGVFREISIPNAFQGISYNCLEKLCTILDNFGVPFRRAVNEL